jgi:hypothetical protein
MPTNMKQGFQILLQQKSQLCVDTISGRLYHICGGTRYLQEYPYILMLHISHIIDPYRAKDIFQEWSRLLFEEAGEIPDFVYDLELVLNILFKYICIAEKVIHSSELIHNWFKYHCQKDVWFGYRNKRLCMSYKEGQIFKYLDVQFRRISSSVGVIEKKAPIDHSFFLSDATSISLDKIHTLFPKPTGMEYERMEIPVTFPRRKIRLPNWSHPRMNQVMGRFIRSESHEALLAEMHITPSAKREVEVSIYKENGETMEKIFSTSEEKKQLPTLGGTNSAPRLVYESWMNFLPEEIPLEGATKEQIITARKQHLKHFQEQILTKMDELSSSVKDKKRVKTSVSAIQRNMQIWKKLTEEFKKASAAKVDFLPGSPASEAMWKHIYDEQHKKSERSIGKDVPFAPEPEIEESFYTGRMKNYTGGDEYKYEDERAKWEAENIILLSSDTVKPVPIISPTSADKPKVKKNVRFVPEPEEEEYRFQPKVEEILSSSNVKQFTGGDQIDNVFFLPEEEKPLFQQNTFLPSRRHNVDQYSLQSTLSSDNINREEILAEMEAYLKVLTTGGSISTEEKATNPIWQTSSSEEDTSSSLDWSNSSSGPRVIYEAWMSFLPEGVNSRSATPAQITAAKMKYSLHSQLQQESYNTVYREFEESQTSTSINKTNK